MHEILTLQIGEAANYLGTHFWNVQESYFTYDTPNHSPVNHDIHFRPGIGADGADTFTPRLLIYDFKNRFGTLRKVNELYQTSDQDTLANPALVTKKRQPSIPLHEYQRSLNQGQSPVSIKPDSIRFWSDYNRIYYHPKSIVQIYEDELSPQQTSFTDWTHGHALFERLDKPKDILDDDVRPLVEECDHVQGFQVLASVDNGWGGFAAQYVDALCDEYGKSSLWVWALNGQTTTSRAQQNMHSANQARSLVHMSPQADVYIPLAKTPTPIPRFLHVDGHALWGLSAVQCFALETITLPSRVTSSNGNSAALDRLSRALGLDECQRIAQIDFALQPRVVESSMMDGATNVDHSPPQAYSLFPFSEQDASLLNTTEYGRVEVLRGSHLDELVEQLPMSSSLDLRIRSPLAFPVLDSFPTLYETNNTVRPCKCSIGAALSKSSIIAAWAKHLENASRINFGIDEREVLSDGLKQIASAYEQSNGSPSDEDWDD